MADQIELVFRNESGRVLATLIRLLGDFELAEDAMQDAFAAALHQWSSEGIPANPRAWLVNVGRHKAIDRLRRHMRFLAKRREIEAELLSDQTMGQWIPEESTGGGELEDDVLRLIFTCCHPALPEEAQIALTLRTVCGHHGNRQSVSGIGENHGATAGARQGKDPRRRYSLSGTLA
jgi:RNA polymerase sigma-70 factor, ECF subfamily